MFHSGISHEDTKYALHYIPTTGVLIWNNPRGRVAKGSIAGTVIKGVRWVRLASYLMKGSDIAYFWMTGNWVSTRCKDGDGTNLVWSNIEEVPDDREKISTDAPYTYIRLHQSGNWEVAGNMGATVESVSPITGDTSIRFVQAVFSNGRWSVVSNGVPEPFLTALRTDLDQL